MVAGSAEPSPQLRANPAPRRRNATRVGPHLVPALSAAGSRVPPAARRCRPSLARGGDGRCPLRLSASRCRYSARPAAATVPPAPYRSRRRCAATGLGPTLAALRAKGSSGASPPAAVFAQRGASSSRLKPAGVLDSYNSPESLKHRNKELCQQTRVLLRGTTIFGTGRVAGFGRRGCAPRAHQSTANSAD